MSSELVLLALQIFIARRVVPCEMVSGRVISSVWDHIITDPDVMIYMTNKGIKWNFIIEFVYWMGDIYERKSIGFAFIKVCLTLDQLCSVLVEVEVVINSQPTCYMWV